MVLTAKTRERFIVSIWKQAENAITSFTQEHLDIHLSVFNKETRPEVFDISEYGLDYVGTELRSFNSIKSSLETGLQQLYRKGKNPRYNAIKDKSEIGWDLREAPLQIVVDDNDKVEYLFNGNTRYDILSKISNLDNVICAVYKKNKNFTKSRLALIGGHMNSVTNPNGETSWNDIMQIINNMIAEKELVYNDAKSFSADINKMITFASNGLIKTDTKFVFTFITEKITSITGEDFLFTANDGKSVMSELGDIYRNTPNNSYVSMSAFSDKVYGQLNNWYENQLSLSKNIKPPKDSGIFTTHPDKMSVSVIIHMGAPDPSRSVDDFFKKYYAFIKEFDEVENFLMKNYFVSTTKSNRFNIIGFFQQVKELDDIFEYKTVVSKEAFLEEYHKRYDSKGNKKNYLQAVA